MKHLKLFESFDDDIESICNELKITNWKLNPDGGVDVDGNVDISYLRLTKLPIKFGKVTGYFNCHFNKLNSLEGSPIEVGGNFYCPNNRLTTLEGGPIEVGDGFNCAYNQLTSLEGAPSEIIGNFECSNNELTSIEGGPIYVGEGFFCSYNNLIGLEGGPKEIGGEFDCRFNPIFAVYKLFPDYKSFMDSLDYNYLRGKAIVKIRLEEALDELGIKVPKFIKGYKYI